MHVNRNLTGTGSAAGVISMRNALLPSHLQTADARNDIESPLKTRIFAGDTLNKNARIRITGTATCALQGNNGDADTANDWETINSLTATGTISDANAWQFIRFNVTAYTSGDVIVDYSGISD